MKYILLTWLILLSVLSNILASDYDRYSFDDCFLQHHEKVFVHLEKEVIVAGDWLNFKVYLLNAETLKKSDLSKIVYLQLSDFNDNSIALWQVNTALYSEGGSVHIPDTLSNGTYILSAFTNWNRNLPEDFVFYKPLHIIPVSENVYSLKTITRKAEIEESNGGDQAFDLKIDRNGAFFELEIYGFRSSGNQENLVSVLWQHRGKNIAIDQREIFGDHLRSRIRHDLLPAGVVNVALLSKSEELIYQIPLILEKETTEKLTIHCEKDAYEPGELVSLQIAYSGRDVLDVAELSVSVSAIKDTEDYSSKSYIERFLDIDSELQIQSGQMDTLFQDSAGPVLGIYKPAEDFKYIYTLSNTINLKPCDFLMESAGPVLSGKIVDLVSGKAEKRELVFLSTPDTSINLDYCYTADDGSFHFLLQKDFLQKDLVLQTIAGNGEMSDITWKVDQKRVYNNFEGKEVTLTDKEKDFLAKVRNVALINRIYSEHDINPDKVTPEHAIGQQKPLLGSPSYVAIPSDFVRLPNFREITENILPGVRFRDKGENYYIQMVDPILDYLMPPVNMVFLNGIPFTDLNYILGLSSDDIRKIDVYLSKVYYGELSYNGIISIFTFDEQMPEHYLSQYVLRYQTPEFALQKGYSEDQYARINHRENLPDLRQTLYWNPNILINSGKEHSIHFHASSLKSAYKISVQGITSEGKVLSATRTITVK